MERIWTPLFLPPDPKKVSDLSFSALKIISFLECEAACKSFPSCDNIGYTSSAYSDRKNIFDIGNEDPFSKEQTNSVYPELKYEETNPFNESRDMFEDSFNISLNAKVQNKCLDTFFSQTHKREMEVKESFQPKVQERNFSHIDTKITHYFPAKKADIHPNMGPMNLMKSEVKRSMLVQNVTDVKKCDISTNIYTHFVQNSRFSADRNSNRHSANQMNNNLRFTNNMPEEKYNSHRVEIRGISTMNSPKQDASLEKRKVNSPFFIDQTNVCKSLSSLHKPNNIFFKTVSSGFCEKNRKNDDKKKFDGGIRSKVNEKKISTKKEDKTVQMSIENYIQNENKPPKWDIIHLDSSNCYLIKEDLAKDDIVEVGFTICYREGFCLLNKPINKMKENCFPSGILLYLRYESGSSKMVFFDINLFKEEKLREIISLILNSFIRKICYEAQSLIIFFIDHLKTTDKRESYEWCLLDPLVGGWLLDPDHPQTTFEDLLQFQSVQKGEPEADWMSSCCQYLLCQSQLMETLYSKLTSQSLWNVFFHLETRIIPLLAVMETASIQVDRDKLSEMGSSIAEILKKIEVEAECIVGRKFQLNSHIQLRKILYDELQLDKVNGIKVRETAATGVKSTAESMLQLLKNVHPLPKVVLEFRQMTKLKSTYIDGILQHLDEKNEIVTSWELCSAATGRITSNNPNLQAIPKNIINCGTAGEGLNLRSCFIARDESVFVAADFQQIELRVLAHLSQDQKLLEAFKRNDDIFNTLTKFRLGADSCAPKERNTTKTLIYAFVYGAGLNKLANILSVDNSTATSVTQHFLKSFPSLRDFRMKVVEEVTKHKTLKSLSGRRRLFPYINSNNQNLKQHTERQAINFVIQGSAADIFKEAMLRTELKLKEKKLESTLILQIHDELVWEVKQKDMEEVIDVIKETMEDSSSYWRGKFKLEVALPVSISTGTNWGEMTSV